MQAGGLDLNSVELMEGKLLVVTQRVQKLEILFASRAVLTSDEREAERVAGTLGFPVEVILLSKKTTERKALAKELNVRAWPASRISRVMHCCERTVERWIK